MANPQSTRFTPREIEIFSCILDGMNSCEIAAKLNLSKSTVDNHRKNMRKKCGVKKTVHLLPYFLGEVGTH